MKILIIMMAILWGLLSWFSSSVGLKAEEVTTSNLVNQTFTSDNNWEGQIDGNHGTGIIAGVDGGYIQNTNPLSLSQDLGLNEVQIQNGFSSTQSAQVWFWNSNDQNVVMKQIITDTAGNTTTQTKTVTGYCTTFNGCGWQSTGNNIYVSGLNNNTDYTIKNRFEFNSTIAGNASYSGDHNAADLKQPSLTVTYENQPVAIATQNKIVEDAQEIIEDLPKFNMPIFNEVVVKEFKIEQPIIEVKEKIKIEPLPVFIVEEPILFIENKKLSNTMPKLVEETPLIEEKSETIAVAMLEEATEEVRVEAKKERKEVKKETPVQILEETSTEPKEKLIEEEVIEEDTKIAEVEDKTDNSAKVLAKTINKIDVQIKDITKNLEVKNIVLLAAIQNDSVSLNSYNQTTFYIPTDIYTNQLFIDDRQIYNQVNLSSYIDNDPIIKQERILNDIYYQQQRLKIEIRELKNG
jgi:hypothetical protein